MAYNKLAASIGNITWPGVIALASLGVVSIHLNNDRVRLQIEKRGRSSLFTEQDFYKRRTFQKNVLMNIEHGSFNLWDSLLVFLTCPYGAVVTPPNKENFDKMVKLLFSSKEEINIYVNHLLKNLAPVDEGYIPKFIKRNYEKFIPRVSGSELYENMWEADWLLATLEEISLVGKKLSDDKQKLTNEEKEVIYFFFYGRAAPLVREKHRDAISTARAKNEKTRLVQRARDVIKEIPSIPSEQVMLKLL
jgi:hypothetical protein